MFTKENIKKYYEAICKDLKIEPIKLNFCYVARGGACITHDGKGKLFSIDIDLNRCSDIERGILHEVSHQILILKNNNTTHNTTFKKLEAKLIDKYFYSKFSNILIGKKLFS